jgi:exodeoxyribonuclease VIII
MMVPALRAAEPTNDEYHQGPGLSHSGVKRLLRSPWHYQAINGPHEPIAPTPQMFAGTLCHCAFLEPEEFHSRYVVGPEVSTKAAREWKEFVAANPDREPITQKQHDTAWAQAESLRAHPVIAELMSGMGIAERAIYWTDPETGVLCKAKPDWAHLCGTSARPAAILLDAKTTSDASPEGFAKAIANFGYHTQADWYCWGYEQATGTPCEGMVFAVVENEFPYACAAYMVDDEGLRIARERNRRALNLYAECERKANWPGYPSELQVISLPRWASNERYA